MKNISIMAFILILASCKTQDNELMDASVKGVSFEDMKFIPIAGKSISIQVTEVTRGQWKSVMKKDPESMPHWNDCLFKEATVKQPDHPVSCVSWNHVQDFIQLLGPKYRLPTEEEWAAAAGTVQGSRYGWCSVDRDVGSTNRVGALEPYNGLYDMAGNVWEWTSTFVESKLYVIRGSSWADDSVCSTTRRFGNEPNFRSAKIGFRLVKMP